MAKLDRQQAFDLAGERDWKDPLKEYAQGANTFLSSALGSLDNSIIGDVLRAVKGKPFRQQVEIVLSNPDISQEEKDRFANEYLNADTILQQGQKALKEQSQFWANRKSKKAQASDRYVSEGDGFLDTIGRYAENPATIANQTVGQLPQLLPVAGLAAGLRTKAGQALLQKTGIASANTGTALGGLTYQANVGGQQAREQSLEDSAQNRPLSKEESKAFDDENYIIDPSKINKNAGESSRYSAAKIATNTGAKISGLAGLIGLKSDLALTNLLMGESIKGLSKKGLKAAAGHLAKNIAEETIDEAGSPIGANVGAQQTYEPNRETFKDVGKQAAAGAVLGAGMGSVQAGSLYLFGDGDQNNQTQTVDDLAKAIIRSIPKQDIPKQYQDSFNAFEDAKQAEAQAQAAYEANPTPESEEALAQATDARLKADNQFSQYDAAFKQTFTEQEQKDLLSNDLKGIAARAKLAEEAKQAELNSKAEQEALAKAQRANMVKGLAAYADNEEVLLNEVNQLGLDDTQKELLLREVFAERKNAKAKPQQTQPKTPLELAVDEHFDAKGNRKPSIMSSDVADKHKVTLNELLPAIAKRINDIKIQKSQAEKQAKQQAQSLEDEKSFQQSQAKLEADAKRKAQSEQKAKEQGFKQDYLTEKQQLENTLADFAAENDTDSMLAMLDGYNQVEADKLFNNAFKTVETRAKEAEKATKAKEVETAKQEQAKQKQSAFSTDMSALYESNPNATYNDWKAVGKKHGVTSAIDLANAWANAKSNKPKQKDEQKPKSTETLALPAPSTVMVADAQGNVTPTTENNVPKKPRNNDFSVPSGLKVDISNAENTRSDLGKGSYIGSAMIVRQDGQPFPTEQVAQQALENKATKKPRKNETPVTPETHKVITIDGGYAIAPKSEQQITQEDIIGEYARDTSPNDIIKLVKTETGYDLDFGGISQYYNGEDSLKNAKSFLRKHGFRKIKPKVEIEQQAIPKESVVEQSVEDITGEYTHSQFHDATATVSKTEKGYDINWGDEVQSFTGKNAAEKAQTALKKEGFNKKNPDNDNGGVPVEPVEPKPISPMGGNSTPQATPKTDAEQIASAMDKTAQAITDAAHSKVIERIKNGEEIVYKHPAAVERVKQDDRYQVEINDKGHAVVKNIKALNGEWVKKDDPVVTKDIKQPKPQKKNNEPIKDITQEAVHIENGTTEEVTPEIIRESLAKVDDKPINGQTMSLKEAKQWLLDQVTVAISVAKYKSNDDVLGKNGEKNPKSTDYVAFDVPNDGLFKVLNSIESLQKFKKKVEANRGFDKQSPKKLFPAVPQNSVDTTIAEFLGDGEVENAYEFAKLQDKPIRFGAGRLNGKPIALAYALAEPVDLGSGFKGFVGLSLDKKTDKKEWMFIEENSRLSIGFGSITKQGVIKEAKDRLAQLSNDQKANLLKNSPKLEKTDAELEQQWLSQIGYNPNQNNDEVMADVKTKVQDKQNNALADDIFGAKDAGKAKTEQSDNQKLKSILDDLLSLRDAKKETSVFIADDGKKYNKVQKSVSGKLSKKQYEEIKGIVGLKNTITIENTETKNSGINLIAKTTSEYGSFYAFSTEYTPVSTSPENINETKAKTGIIKVDFPLEETINAWQHSIRNPSEVAKSFKRTFEDFIEEAYNGALRQAETDLQKKVLEQASLKLQQDYIKKFNELNAARSGVVSSFIAGRNNFNGKQAESRGNNFDKVSQRFDNWLLESKYELSTAVQDARSPEQLAKIKAEKDAKEKRAQDKDDAFLRKVLSFKKGDDFKIGQYKVIRVNVNKYGVPISLTLEGDGLIKGLDDKISLFGGKMPHKTADDLKQNIERIKEADSNTSSLTIEDIRKQMIALAAQITQKAGVGSGFFEQAMESRKVPKTMKDEYLALRKQMELVKGKTEQPQPAAIEPVGEAKTMEQRQSESRAEKMADHKKRIDALPIGVRRALSYDIYKEIAENKGDYVDGAYPVNLEPNDIGDMTAYYKEKANKEPRNKGVTVGYGNSKDYALDRKALRELADNGLYSDSYLGDNKADLKEKQQPNPAKKETPKQETNSKTPTLDKHNALMDSVRDGKATAEDFKQLFADVFANKDAILLELNSLTKDQLLKEGGYAVQYRHKNDKKSEVAEAVYHSMIAEYALGRGITYGMGKNSYENAVQKMVDSTNQQRLDDFAQEYKQMIDGRISDLKAKAEALENPQTLNDFRMLMRSIMADGKTRQEAFLTLTPEQRIKYDELEAESTKEAREARKRAEQAKVNTASQVTDGKIIETKHTRDGYDLFVVQLSDRLSTDDYKKVLSEAKKLGGWYSSYKGGGAIVGFQFKNKEAAQAFLALAGGDTTAAKEQLNQKQDDYADNRSQSAAERLLDMAEKIETKANEELERDRKANTARRARFAAAAENEARSQIALAKTMRNIAEAIKNGKAKFLDSIRMKTDVEALRAYITTAKDNEIRAEHKTYAEQVKRKGQPPTAATADFATYPTYTLFRSDLAFLGRQLLEIDGLKKFGQQVMTVADDVSDAYLEFAKKNLFQVSRFQTKDSALASFSSKELAERAIKKSGLTGKAIVLQVKRGENLVILSPSEAINLKVWEGDADKRITLKREFGNQLVEAVGRRAGKNNKLLPYQFQYAYDKLKALSRIGIETPSEFRSALREFIALQEQVVNNKVREMELAMVGRKNDGLDFFPTPEDVAQQMIDSAEITEDMAVLEPSAGMGHIADMIRAAGAEPDVIEMSGERRELLQEKGYHLAEVNDFMDMKPREFYTFGDVFIAPDGKEGVMRGSNGQRVRLEDDDGKIIGYYNRDDLVGERHKGVDSGYDRIIMNPPFSNRQDAEHVRHAYDLLKPNGRIVAIMGEGVFFGSDKKAVEFRDWLESVGGTSEKLPDNSFMDKSLPVNTGVNARMVIIDKQETNNQDTDNNPKFSRAESTKEAYEQRIDELFNGEKPITEHGKGVKLLDNSDVLTLLGYTNKPVTLAEAKVSIGINNHPAITAEHWKKIPDWIENPAAVFESDTDGGLVFIAPETVGGRFVSVIVRPDTDNRHSLGVHIALNMYDRSAQTPFMRWINDGLLRFVDTKKFPTVYEEASGRQLPRQALQNKSGTKRILTEKQLAGYRRSSGVNNSKSSTIGDRTITQVRDKLISRFGKRIVEQLESKGILKIHQSMSDKDIPAEAVKQSEGVTEGFYLNGTVHLIADNLTDETIIPTFVHELGGHKGFQEMMSPKAYELIMQQFDRLVTQGNAIAIKAKQRAEKAEKDTARQQDEYIPYLLTEQEKAQFATPQERNTVKRLIDHILRAVKGWVVRTLSKYSATAGISKRVSETLDARDIQLMAERMIKDIAKRGGDNNNRPKFSKTEQAQFDRLLTKADKMIAEQGQLLAPNGRPSKLNRVQWAQVRTDNFKAWFGDWENDPANASKVVDENGEPLVVYHGTTRDFSEYDKNQYNSTSSADDIDGFFASSNPYIAGTYTLDESNYDIAYSEKGTPLSKKKSFIDIYGNVVSMRMVGTQYRNNKGEPISYQIINQDIDYKETPNILPVFMDVKKPKYFFGQNGYEESWGYNPSINEDGVIRYAVTDEFNSRNESGLLGNTYIVFDPTQIKSAIGNNGDFSSTNPDIRFSRAEDKAKAAKDYVLDSVRISNKAKANLHAKAELGRWSKTFGTQLNTAKKFKDFDRVYKLLQRLLQHQSSDVMDALEAAPTLLEKLDSLSDLKEQGKSIGRNIAQYAKKVRTGEMTDREAVAKVIFSETLAKEALSQADLEQKLTPQQLKIYEEAREAINVSLKNTAKSEVIRSLLQAEVINFDTVEKLLNQQTGFDGFIDEMLENVGARISNAQEELSQSETDVEKQAIKNELKRLADMYNSISDVNTKVYNLIDEAYAPLMRFGDYALTMRDKDGKVLSFMMFETKAERNRMVNYLGSEYGDTVTLETDTMSTEEFKQFKGITPESLALFAKEIGLSKGEATQAYLKLAIPATSALTRRIRRKGIEGYNEDIQRVLASFVMSNARYSAKNIYLDKVNKAINDIESGKSIKDQAIKMRDNTINPVDTFAWLRDLLFVWNLGGSVMFAFLNMTQPFMQTLPMLSQYVNTSFATKHILRGIKVAGAAMATGNAPKGYEAEYKRAVQEGIVDPQNTFMLTGLERGGTGTTSKAWTATKHILGLFAQASESLNRKAVFVASLEVAKAKGSTWLKQKGFDSAYDFAVDVIAQTQGVYNKANRSNWAHNPLGAPLLVFKQFSINYVEQMVRMWKNQSAGEEGKKAVLLAMLMLFSLAGGMGLPFIKDMFDVSETIAAHMGNPINIEREMRLMGKQYLGETTTGALMDGWLNKLVIGEVLGADVQSRTGMGDLIPMTNALNPVLSPSQRTNEAMSIFGAAGGLGEKASDSIQLAANDEFGNAIINILPRFATSMYRGAEMMTTGETTDSKGRKLFDTTFGEGLVKFADSQPVRMAELSRARGLEYDDIAIQRSKTDYYRKKWIKAAQKEDMESIEQIEQDIEDWNEDNEKYPVIFDRQRAYQSANKNEMTWGEREEKTQKGMDWLQDERPEWMQND